MPDGTITKPRTTHADIAADMLRQALTTAHVRLRDAVTTYRSAYAGLSESADLLDVLRAAGGLLLAAEAIADAFFIDFDGHG